MFYYNYFRECRKNRKELSFIFTIRFLILLVLLLAMVFGMWFAYQQVTIASKQKALREITEYRDTNEYETNKNGAYGVLKDYKNLESENEFFKGLSEHLATKNINLKDFIGKLRAEADALKIEIDTINIDSTSQMSLHAATEKGKTANEKFANMIIQQYMEKLDAYSEFLSVYPTYNYSLDGEGNHSYDFYLTIQLKGE